MHKCSIDSIQSTTEVARINPLSQDIAQLRGIWQSTASNLRYLAYLSVKALENNGVDADI